MRHNIKSITNDEIFKLISGGSSSRKGGNLEYKSLQSIVTAYLILLSDFETEFPNGKISTYNDNNNLYTNNSSIDGLNELLIASNNIIQYFIRFNSKQINNIDYNTLNEGNKEYFRPLVTTLNYLVPIVISQNRYLTNDIPSNIDVDKISFITNQIHIELLYNSKLYDKQGIPSVDKFITFFQKLRMIIIGIFDYYIHIIDKTRNTSNRQMYTYDMSQFNEKYTKSIYYYRKHIDKLFSLTIDNFMIVSRKIEEDKIKKKQKQQPIGYTRRIIYN